MRRESLYRCCLGAALLLAIGAQASEADVLQLYDGSLASAPEAQGKLDYLSIPTTSETLITGGVKVDTTGNTDSAGYSNYTPQGTFAAGTFPSLDRPSGIGLRFTVDVDSETHTGTNGPNRAGFSVIVVAGDNKGIELGFWSDQVWAQEGGTNNLFTKAESASFNTTNATTYNLSIVADKYVLTTGSTILLSGAVRDYTAFTGVPDVYEMASFLFLGDNTSSASAVFSVFDVAVNSRIVSDMNGDGVVTVSDTDAIELALTRPEEYEATFPNLSDYKLRGDVNGNGRFDNFDLEPFQQSIIIIISPSPTSPRAIPVMAATVPEPAALQMAAWALAGLALVAVQRMRSLAERNRSL